LDAFREFSQRYFALFAQIEDDSKADATANAIARWSSTVAESVLTGARDGPNYRNFQIIVNALASKRCRIEIWKRSFEEIFRKILQTADFSRPGANLLLDVIDIAWVNRLCDPLVATDLGRAFESADVKFRCKAFKLLADAVSGPPPQLSVAKFVEEKITPQIGTLLNGDPVIGNIVLQVLSNAAIVDPPITRKFSDRERLPLIMSRIVDSSYAMSLVLQIVKARDTTIDVLIGAGLIHSLVKAMANPDCAQAVDLLFMILGAVAGSMTGGQVQQQILALLQTMSPLAGLAFRCAEVVPEVPRAEVCIGLILHVFSPPMLPGELRYGNCFEPLGKSILKLVETGTVRESLPGVVQMLTRTAERLPDAKDIMKKVPIFVDSIRRLAADGPNRVKPEAAKLLKLLE
jgi:hypothetical protein